MPDNLKIDLKKSLKIFGSFFWRFFILIFIVFIVIFATKFLYAYTFDINKVSFDFPVGYNFDNSFFDMLINIVATAIIFKLIIGLKFSDFKLLLLDLHSNEILNRLAFKRALRVSIYNYIVGLVLILFLASILFVSFIVLGGFVALFDFTLLIETISLNKNFFINLATILAVISFILYSSWVMMIVLNKEYNLFGDKFKFILVSPEFDIEEYNHEIQLENDLTNTKKVNVSSRL